MKFSTQVRLRLKRIKELFQYFFHLWKEMGFVQTVRRAAAFFKRRFGNKKGRLLPTKATLAAQKAADTSAFAFISVCVPLYNTPQAFLRQLIDGMLAQTCTKWQLVLADASDNDMAKSIVDTYSDERIIYAKIENKSIAENTNAAVQLAGGTYVGLLDHDDVLAPHAIYEMCAAIAQTGSKFLYSDEALFENDIVSVRVAHFKPDFAPYYLRCCNYICHFAVIEKTLYRTVGGERAAYDGSQDHDLFLRLSEKETPYHIPKVLYYWRITAASTSGGTAAKPYVRTAAINAVQAQLERLGIKGSVTDGKFDSTYKVDYEIEGNPLVSILIPNKDHTRDLEKCIQSIVEKTAYTNYEIIVIENNSTEPVTEQYYTHLPKRYPACRVVRYGDKFNYSAINNMGRLSARGEYLLLLNNDVEVINAAWLGEMLQLAVQPQVGAVGAMLYYPDNTMQHAGVITGLGGYAGHSHKYLPRGASGYMFRAGTVQDFSAVTAACMLVKASVFDELDGLDESFAVAFNDVDFCLRVRAAGYHVLWTPYAELYHYESKSRGADVRGDAKERFGAEQALLHVRYADSLLQDEFYNRNLTKDREDFRESDVLPNDR